MINLLLASTEGPTPDEIISGASEAVQEAVDKKVAGAVSDAIGALFDGLSSQLGFAVLYTVVALAVLGLAVALLMYRFKRDRLKDYAKVAFGVIAGLAIMATVLIATVEFYNINNYEGGVPEVYFKPALALVCIAIGRRLPYGAGVLLQQVRGQSVGGSYGFGDPGSLHRPHGRAYASF